MLDDDDGMLCFRLCKLRVWVRCVYIQVPHCAIVPAPSTGRPPSQMEHNWTGITICVQKCIYLLCPSSPGPVFFIPPKSLAFPKQHFVR